MSWLPLAMVNKVQKQLSEPREQNVGNSELWTKSRKLAREKRYDVIILG